MPAVATTSRVIGLVLMLASCAAPRPSTNPSAEMESAPPTATAPEAPPPASAAGEPSTEPTDARECAARGGTMQPVCRMQKVTCVLTYADGGKSCSDKKDCTGECIYEGDASAPPSGPVTGACQRTSDPCGCRAPVSAGKVMPMMCVD